YGALSTANGHIDLKWSHEANGRLNLRWIETGGPTVEPPARSGFGGRVIERMIGQVKGGGALTGTLGGSSAKSHFGGKEGITKGGLSIRTMATVGDCLGFQSPSPLFLCCRVRRITVLR